MRIVIKIFMKVFDICVNMYKIVFLFGIDRVMINIAVILLIIFVLLFMVMFVIMVNMV